MKTWTLGGDLSNYFVLDVDLAELPGRGQDIREVQEYLAHLVADDRYLLRILLHRTGDTVYPSDGSSVCACGV